MAASDSSERYNGWTNYETWLVNLWLSNDEPSYRFWRQRTADHRTAAPEAEQVQAGIWTAEQAARFGLADELKESIEEAAADALPQSGMMSDLLGAAVSRVDWHEIAEHMLDEEAEA